MIEPVPEQWHSQEAESGEASDDIPYVLPVGPAVAEFDFRAVPWTWRDVLIGLGTPVLLAGGLSLERNWLQVLPVWSVALLAVFTYLWIGVYPVWQGRRRCRDTVWRWPSWRQGFLEAMLALMLLPGWYFMLGAVLWLWSRVSDRQPDSSLVRLSEEAGPHPVLIGMLVTAFTIAPLFEELFFRGFLFNAWRRWLALPVALLLQAVTFGLFHPLNVAYVLATGYMGLFLGVVYEWRRTLLAPMFLHGFHNFIVAVGAFWLMTQAVQTPVMGINGQEDPAGVRITEVSPGFGAERAGLRPGDIVVQVDQSAVSTLMEVRRALRPFKAGEWVRIHFLRDGETHEVEVELQGRPR